MSLVQRVADAIRATMESQPLSDESVPGRTEAEQYRQLAVSAIAAAALGSAREAEAAYWRALAVRCRAVSDVSRATAVQWSSDRHVAEAINTRAEAEQAEADAADCVADAIEGEA